jgi:hypothetical protein
MILALDGRYENFTLGKHVSVEQVREIQRLAERHGFRIANPRSFEKPVTDDQIDQIRSRARERLMIARQSAASETQAAPV